LLRLFLSSACLNHRLSTFFYLALLFVSASTAESSPASCLGLQLGKSRFCILLPFFSRPLIVAVFLCPRSTAFRAKYYCTVSFCGPSKPKCPSLNGSAGVHVLSRSSTALFFCFMFAVSSLNFFCVNVSTIVFFLESFVQLELQMLGYFVYL
jgi:hypothetical protein